MSKTRYMVYVGEILHSNIMSVIWFFNTLWYWNLKLAVSTIPIFPTQPPFTSELPSSAIALRVFDAETDDAQGVLHPQEALHQAPHRAFAWKLKVATVPTSVDFTCFYLLKIIDIKHVEFILKTTYNDKMSCNFAVLTCTFSHKSGLKIVKNLAEAKAKKTWPLPTLSKILFFTGFRGQIRVPFHWIHHIWPLDGLLSQQKHIFQHKNCMWQTGSAEAPWVEHMEAPPHRLPFRPAAGRAAWWVRAVPECSQWELCWDNLGWHCQNNRFQPFPVFFSMSNICIQPQVLTSVLLLCFSETVGHILEPSFPPQNLRSSFDPSPSCDHQRHADHRAPGRWTGRPGRSRSRRSTWRGTRRRRSWGDRSPRWNESHIHGEKLNLLSLSRCKGTEFPDYIN